MKSLVLLSFLQSLPPISVDLSSTLIAAIGFVLVFLGKRAVTGIDRNFDDVKATVSINHQSLTGEIKELRIDLNKTKDKSDDKITAVRLDIENKLEVHDIRIRDLEKRGN